MNPTEPIFFLLAYLAVLYVRPHEYVPALSGVPILPVFLAASTILWMARQKKNLTASQFKLLPVQALLMAWSVLLSGWPGGAISTLTEFLPAVLLYFMLATTVDSVRRLRQVFFVLSAVMLVIALHSIDQIEQGIGWTGAKLINGRVAYLGFLSDPNDLSMAMLMVLPMTLYLARKSGWAMRLFWLATAMAIIYAVKLANSRGAILSLAAMMFQFGIFRYGLMKSMMVAPVMLLPIIIFGPSRMNEMSASEESAEGRIDAWYAGFQMLMQHPLFGVGKGQFVEHNYLTAHNSYVLALAELGVIGYTVWISNIFLTWVMAFKVQSAGVPELAKPQDASPRRGLAKGAPVDTWADVHEGMRTLWYGFSGGLLAMFFLSRSYVTILYVHMALIVAMYQLARQHRPDIEPVGFAARRGQLFGFSIASIITLWLVTMVLLRIK